MPGQAKIPNSCPFIGLKVPVIVSLYMHFYQSGLLANLKLLEVGSN